jgi:hypothetical protein
MPCLVRIAISHLEVGIGKLSKLVYLDVSSCSAMEGTIPTELGRLSELRVINLSNGQFHGTLPTEMLSLPMLEKLYRKSSNYFVNACRYPDSQVVFCFK